MKKLIINADDFGLSPGVNNGIIEGFKKGIIREASIMANMSYFEEAINLAKGNPELGVGIHLNLTWGKPVSAAKNISSLVNKNGYFELSAKKLLFKSLFGYVKVNEVEIELRHQIEKVIKFGIKLSHLNSHQHIHVFPKIRQIIFKMARDYRIGVIRCPIESSLPSKGGGLLGDNVINQINSFVISKISKSFRNKAESLDFKSADYFYGIRYVGKIDFSLLRYFISNIKNGVNELSCHPGNVDFILEQIPSRIIYHRQQELDALLDSRLSKLLRENNISLCSFKDI